MAICQEVIACTHPDHLREPLVITVRGLPRPDNFSPSPHMRVHLLALSTAKAFSTLSLGICNRRLLVIKPAQSGPKYQGSSTHTQTSAGMLLIYRASMTCPLTSSKPVSVVHKKLRRKGERGRKGREGGGGGGGGATVRSLVSISCYPFLQVPIILIEFSLQKQIPIIYCATIKQTNYAPPHSGIMRLHTVQSS